ncbi:MAG: asparagine synthase (glutamine-hydrolyzing), partial [Rhodobacterales bacterium]|nr:asparagine synthase (glutamine-hydrolyzing) [Rhodobacterales bacterium]
IHDGGHLVLHRDPFGIKPLYVAEGDFGLLFASEPQALVASGLVAAATDDGSLAEVAQLQFSCGARTPWAGIRRLLPGETLVVRAGRVVDSRRRAALPPGGPRPWTRDDALMELDRLLTDSVTLHQRSDVPYGMFLSGGVDSSVVLAMMARLNDRPVVAFTAGFPDTGVHDERDHARAVAQAAGAEHHEVAVSEDDFWAHLPAIAAAVDDPTPDYAVLPTYLLARAARAAGLKVVLSGEGGDELFGGYGRYRRAGRPRLLGGRPMRARGALDGLLRDDGGAWRAAYGVTEIRDGGRTALQAAQATDIADWLPHDLLTKLDRCLMAHGVEGRVPFVDPVLADFALTLPDALKVRRGQGKWLLRAWLNTALPAARPFTPKRGFTVPVGDWIARRAADLGPRVAASPVVERLCRPGAVDGLFRSLTRGQADRRAGQAAWTLLFLALWHRAHRDGATIDGGVMDVL